MKFYPCIILLIGLALPFDTIAQWKLLSGPYCGGNIGYVTQLGSQLFAAGAMPMTSTDNGNHWRSIGSMTGVRAIIQVENGLLVGTESGIYRSSDNGVHWTSSSTGITGTPTIFALLESDSVLLAGTYAAGLFRSSDHGSTWVPSSSGLTNQSIRAMTKSGGIVLAATANGVFRSGNNGLSWVRSDSGLTFSLASAIGAQDSVVVVGTYGGGLFRSTDLGTTWKKGIDSLPSANIEAVVSCNNVWFAGTSGGIRYSVDTGRSWQILNGTQAMAIQTLMSRHDTLYAGTFGGLYRCVSPTYHWPPCGVTTPAIYLLRSTDNSLYVCGASGGIVGTTDEGATWQPETPGITNGTPGAILPLDSSFLVGRTGGVFVLRRGTDTLVNTDTVLTSYYVSDLVKTDSFIYAGTIQNGVFRSKDGGVSWDGPSDDMALTRIRFMTTIGNVVFAVRQDSGIFRSTDNGDHWTSLTIDRYDRYPTSLAVAGNTLIASYQSTAIRRSTDQGETWTIVPLQLSATIVGLAASGDQVFAATYSGVLAYSSDAGLTWIVSDSFPQLINKMIIHRNALYLATNVGVWRRPLVELSAPRTELSQQPELILAPNPTDGIVRIEGLAGACSIRVIDELGRVRMSERSTEGSAATMDVSALPPGCYVVKIKSSHWSVSRLLRRVQ